MVINVSRVEVKTIIDFKTYKDYFIFNLKRRKTFIILIILGILAIVFSIINILKIVNAGDQVKFELISPLIVLFALYALYYVIYNIKIHASYKSNKVSMQTPLVYYFTDDNIQIGIEGRDEIKNRVIVKYQELKYIFETTKYFYLVLQNNKMYILKKDGFLKGTALELEAMMRAIVGLPYKKLK